MPSKSKSRSLAPARHATAEAHLRPDPGRTDAELPSARGEVPDGDATLAPSTRRVRRVDGYVRARLAKQDVRGVLHVNVCMTSWSRYASRCIERPIVADPAESQRQPLVVRRSPDCFERGSDASGFKTPRRDELEMLSAIRSARRKALHISTTDASTAARRPRRGRLAMPEH